MRIEADVKKAVKELLDSYGQAAWYFMPVPTGYGMRGIPDFIVCFKGLFMAIETKAPDKSTALKGLQRQHQIAIVAANGLHYVVHNEADVSALKIALDELFRSLP